MDARTDGRTDGQRENSIPPTNKVCGGYNKIISFFPEKKIKKKKYVYYPKKHLFFYLALPDLHVVGICTVQRSSDDSSVEVPIKSNVKQLWARRRQWDRRPCWKI